MADPALEKEASPLRIAEPRLTARFTYSVGEFGLRAEFSLAAPHTVLFGASGAGKSTLLRLLAGIIQPTEGHLTLHGVPLTDTSTGLALPPGSRGIGYVTQEPALFPHLSVASNLAFGLHSLARAARAERVAAMLALFSLEPLAHRMPARLSGGERQRVALARALAPSPALLLLDEPFAALDPERREETNAALTRCLAVHAAEGRPTTLLTVSHDVAAIYASGAEVLLLSSGRIVEQGLAKRVLASERARLLRLLESPFPDQQG